MDPKPLHRAFTLIELLAALVILALLTGAAALSFAKPIRNARAKQAIDLIQRSDAMTREQARRFGEPMTLLFDLREQTLQRSSSPHVRLPSGYAIRDIRTPDRWISEGQFQVDVSRLGLSRSYAVHLVGPGVDRWLMVMGLSGEVTQTNESQVQQMLSLATRDNAR